jgi:hypothetical protein
MTNNKLYNTESMMAGDHSTARGEAAPGHSRKGRRSSAARLASEGSRNGWKLGRGEGCCVVRDGGGCPKLKASDRYVRDPCVRLVGGWT